jgi:hypothetical protein
MSRPNRHLFHMALFLAAVAGLAILLYPGLASAFLSNPALNGMIVGVFFIGVGLNFRQVLILFPEIDWVEAYRRGQPILSARDRLRLLAPMASMLGERDTQTLSLSQTSTRALIDGISLRLEENRDVSRYFVGLLIFLGLLGTFWGLLETVASIGTVIKGLSFGSDNIETGFAELKRGLELPLHGMGTAFGSSLFGLAGSLVLGFLDLQAGQAQNQFLNDLEEWLAGLTRLSSGGPIADGEASVPAYLQALLEKTADGLDGLSRAVQRGEDGRHATNVALKTLADKMSALSDQMKAEQHLMIKLAENQMELKPVLAKLADGAGGGGMDESTRGHIRNIDLAVSRLAEEMQSGRELTIGEVRSEIRLLARTISALAEGPQ